MKFIIFKTGSIKSNLAGFCRTVRNMVRWLIHRNWLRLLQAVKLVIEVAKEIRNLLFCKHPWAITVGLS